MKGGSGPVRTLLLLGGGELAREVAISARRLGIHVVVADRYDGAPAMAVAQAREVISLRDGTALEGVIRTHRPDLVLPEVEGIRTETLQVLEGEGYRMAPGAEPAHRVRNRETLRRLASETWGLPTAAFAVAGSEAALQDACDRLGYPCVVKPMDSTLGRGQSIVSGPARVEHAWAYAQEGGEGEFSGVMVEEFVEFETELTLLTVREWDGTLHFLDPIAHRQERGDYRESWLPTGVEGERLDRCREIAAAAVEGLGGAGVFGVELFLTDDEILFSEISPGPHDTGLLTLLSHTPNQFDLHLRAVLGLPIPEVTVVAPAASAVILADRDGTVVGYEGVERALQVEGAQIHLFGKPEAHPFRRMGVALAAGDSVNDARARALEAASRVRLRVE